MSRAKGFASERLLERLATALAAAPVACDERCFNTDVPELAALALRRERQRLRSALGLIPDTRLPWTRWADERLVLVERELEARRRGR